MTYPQVKADGSLDDRVARLEHRMDAIEKLASEMNAKAVELIAKFQSHPLFGQIVKRLK